MIIDANLYYPWNSRIWSAMGFGAVAPWYSLRLLVPIGLDTRQIEYGDGASSGPSGYTELTPRLSDLAHRFQGGFRGQASRVITNLLSTYVAVEQPNQYGR